MVEVSDAAYPKCTHTSEHQDAASILKSQRGVTDGHGAYKLAVSNPLIISEQPEGSDL